MQKLYCPKCNKLIIKNFDLVIDDNVVNGIFNSQSQEVTGPGLSWSSTPTQLFSVNETTANLNYRVGANLSCEHRVRVDCY